jgi:hypothetical protein
MKLELVPGAARGNDGMCCRGLISKTFVGASPAHLLFSSSMEAEMLVFGVKGYLFGMGRCELHEATMMILPRLLFVR